VKQVQPELDAEGAFEYDALVVFTEGILKEVFSLVPEV